DEGRLRPVEKVEKEQEAERYRAGLPKILERMAGYMKPDDGKALRELAGRYHKLLEVPPAKLERDEFDALGREIEERFGALAFEPAYKRLAIPIAAFQYGTGEGSQALKKRVADAAEDARNATEDNDAKALAAAKKKLESLAPELDGVAKSV